MSTSEERDELTRCKSDFWVPTFGIPTGGIIAIIIVAVLLYIALLVALLWQRKPKSDVVKVTTTIVKEGKGENGVKEKEVDTSFATAVDQSASSVEKKGIANMPQIEVKEAPADLTIISDKQ